MTARSRAARTGIALGLLVSLLVGLGVAILVGFEVLGIDAICPGYDDEGSMAAPGSPYTAVICRTEDSFFLGTAAIIAVVPLLLYVVLRRRSVALRVAIGLLAPTLVLTLLHVALPRDCLGGATRSGDCSRDRELR